MAVIGGINCYDMRGSGRVSVQMGKARAGRVLICPWADRFTVKDALLGGVLRGPSQVQVVYDDPLTFPGWDDLACIGVEIEGLGAPTAEDGDGGPTYSKAIITATYEPLLWTPGTSESDRIVMTEVRDHSIEVLMLPNGTWEWDADAPNEAEPVVMGVPMYVPITTRVFTRMDLEEIPEDVQDYVGYINTDAYLGAEPGCLLYAGANIERRVGRSGENRYQARYIFKQRQQSWNMFFHPTDGVWRGIRDRNSGDGPYPDTTLSILLRGIAV